MSYDVDLFVIGAGSGGVRAARFAADFGARVAIAESRYLGGTCVNVGCVPKKLFVQAAHFSASFAHAAGFGWVVPPPRFDWQTLLANKNREIARLNGIYRSLLDNSGVTVLDGHARLRDAHSVEINGQVMTARHILLATGGWPRVPDIPGKELAITSNDVFFLPELPRRVVVVGGGYIAVEMASVFHGLGAEVVQLYRGDLFLRGFDDDVRQHLRAEFERKALTVRFNADVAAIARQADGSLRLTLHDGSHLDTDCVLFATGRQPQVEDLGLENTAVARDENGFIRVNDDFETSEPSILAIGDVIGRLPLTPVALAEGMAVARKLFRPADYRRVDYRLIPTAVFSLPNVATVGMSEDEACREGHEPRVFESRFRPLPLTLTDDQERTYMKLVVDGRTDRVLGCHMVGEGAGEIIQGLAVALKAGASKQVFDDTIGIHPTAAEEFVTLRRARGE